MVGEYHFAHGLLSHRYHVVSRLASTFICGFYRSGALVQIGSTRLRHIRTNPMSTWHSSSTRILPLKLSQHPITHIKHGFERCFLGQLVAQHPVKYCQVHAVGDDGGVAGLQLNGTQASPAKTPQALPCALAKLASGQVPRQLVTRTADTLNARGCHMRSPSLPRPQAGKGSVQQVQSQNSWTVHGHLASSTFTHCGWARAVVEDAMHNAGSHGSHAIGDVWHLNRRNLSKI